ncbi:uncharacterized protein CLUP02_02585 [Colletotrichum lupini]|uniref:Uncharacterized protein n=1 Tax=Colletotrichum lupini TaxID=145971 RepID=A0A9Q8SHB1_9PEZI|nr:uncharacterized protein CLUP02_02585 [Colletotrichum lupini]UQC77118.1 hypothetical protein CLUP02_02585 [Colletotrichum lupini]
MGAHTKHKDRSVDLQKSQGIAVEHRKKGAASFRALYISSDDVGDMRRDLALPVLSRKVPTVGYSAPDMGAQDSAMMLDDARVKEVRVGLSKDETFSSSDLKNKQHRKLGASDGTGWLESESLGRPPYWNHRKMTLTGDGKASLRIHPQSFDNERKGPL